MIMTRWTLCSLLLVLLGSGLWLVSQFVDTPPPFASGMAVVPSEKDLVPAPDVGQQKPAPKLDDDTRSGSSRERALETIEKARLVLSKLRENQSSERAAQNQKEKLDSYRSVLKSWGIDGEQLTQAMSILEERDNSIKRNMDALIAKTLEPAAVGRLVGEARRYSESEMANVVGKELASKFASWEVTERKRRSTSRPAAAND